MSKLVTAQLALLALLNTDARPADVAAPDWPSMFSATPDPAKITAIAQVKGDIVSKTKENLQKLGAGVVVMLPAIKFPANTTEQIGLALAFAVVVTTNPTLNKTGFTAEAIVERAIRLIHFKSNGVAVVNRVRSSLFSIDRNAASQMEPTAATSALNNYIIRVNTEIHL